MLKYSRIFHQTKRSLSSSNSKRHYERRLLNHSQSDCYTVVADVSNYSQFLPWIKDSKITKATDENNIEAELVVGFGIFTERYTSHVTLVNPSKVIAVSSETTLFQHLKTEWQFSRAKDPKSCWVTFQVDFEFRSAVYNKLSEVFLKEIVDNMVEAFQSECKKKYTLSKI